MFCFSRADPKKGRLLLTAPTWAPVLRRSSLSSIFCNMFSFFSAALVIVSTAEMQASRGEETLSSNSCSLVATSPTVASSPSYIKLITANKWTYVKGVLCTTLCNKGRMHDNLSGFIIVCGSLWIISRTASSPWWSICLGGKWYHSYRDTCSSLPTRFTSRGFDFLPLAQSPYQCHYLSLARDPNCMASLSSKSELSALLSQHRTKQVVTHLHDG